MIGDNMSNLSPQEVSSYISLIASAIDKSAKPKADLVTNDIKCAIAALNGDEKAVARIKGILASATKTEGKPAPAKVAADASLGLKFSGPLSEDLLKRTAHEIAKKRPGYKGKDLEFTLSVKAK